MAFLPTLAPDAGGLADVLADVPARAPRRRAPEPGRPLRVALYYPWLYLTSGAERTVLELARRSRHQVTVFTNEYQPDATFPELRDVDVRVLPRVPVQRTIGAVARAGLQLVRQRIDLRDFDALLVVCEGLGDLVALTHREPPAYCLCLTPLRIVFDPVYRAEYLAKRGAATRAVVRAGSGAFRIVDRAAWRRYRGVAVISEEIKRRVVAGGLADAERLQVMHPGVDLSRYAALGDAAEHTFFVPGRIMWTKNLELAIRAFQRFRGLVHDPETWRLRIAGIVDRKSEPYLARLRELAGGDPAIEFLVHPSDERMHEEYGRCYATLFTAFNEDWGLVMIEALASGKPVVATDRGGPREIVRHEVDGLLADPTPDAFALAMARLAEEPGLRDRLAAAAPEGASRFGWEPLVERLDDMIDRDLRGAEGRPVADRPVPLPAAAVELPS